MVRKFRVMTASLLTLLSLTAACRAETRPVYLRVLMPSDKATLTIDGTPTRQSGPSRLFVSPPLQPGRDFTYTLVAHWEPNGYSAITRTRTVTVRAGGEVEVDLRREDPKHPDKIKIVFVPTPDEVVEAMCKLAGVGKDDIVYDLGCGDGRIVIAAVKDHGAKRGVGVDLDPDRVKDSRANAKGAGVQDKLEFRQGDVLDIKDLADASVVMLYMGEDVNRLLRPILQKTLKPGSRIVSHEFGMGSWKPLKTEHIADHDGVVYTIHLWKLGENGAGKQ